MGEAAARRVRLLALDVDGVLTDNAVWLGVVAGQRVEFKRFDIGDGQGWCCWGAPGSTWPGSAVAPTRRPSGPPSCGSVT
jgi:3-deoxy-D-manno-octulosonate 8-phosphate phosphatase KdsC-like HAD superfamily phosphatase